MSRYKSISIIGMRKNVGKTTTLNCMLKQADSISVGLTSIGVDGEREDRVYKTPKPEIYVKTGSLIATAERCFLDSDITLEILEITNVNTPLGRIIIAKALSDGYIELAGPSINTQIKWICERLEKLGAHLTLVDGHYLEKPLHPQVLQMQQYFVQVRL